MVFIRFLWVKTHLGSCTVPMIFRGLRASQIKFNRYPQSGRGRSRILLWGAGRAPKARKLWHHRCRMWVGYGEGVSPSHCCRCVGSGQCPIPIFLLLGSRKPYFGAFSGPSECRFHCSICTIIYTADTRDWSIRQGLEGEKRGVGGRS